MPTPRADESRRPSARRWLPALIGLAFIVAAGVSQGVLAGRWSRSRAIEDGAASLGRAPAVIGDWEGADVPVDRRAMEMAEAAGYLMRRYKDRRTGRAADVLVVCGRPGPIAVHTPEVCYGGVGYEAESTTARVKLGADEAWALDLAKPGPVAADRLHILYCWGTGGAWEAADAPRLRFAGSPVLYKVYVIVTPARAEKAPDDAAEQFARLFLPTLRDCVRPASAAARPTGSIGGA
jgi:hypothetical protein